MTRFFTWILIVCIASIVLPREVFAQHVMPKHELQVMLQIKEGLKDIHVIKGANSTIYSVKRDAQKTPTDVYDKTYVLLQNLVRLSQKPGYKILKPIDLPPRQEGRKVPADSLALMQIALEIVTAIRFSVGSDKEISPTPLQQGVTPPDIYQELERANRLLEVLL